MKTSSLLLSLLCAGTCFAGTVETWTSKDGKAAQMELVKVTKSGDELVGQFKLKNGQTASLAASKLSDADGLRLAAWQDPSKPVAKPSVFDAILKDNLVKLSGSELKPCTDATKPVKYYLFYQSASWCGPCKAFTPSLVEFYNKTKPGNDQFELVLITHDRTEDAMTAYAVADKMAWPMIKMSEAPKLLAQLKPPGNGIPNLTLTDLDGNILKASFDGDKYLGPQVVVDYLKEQLKK